MDKQFKTLVDFLTFFKDEKTCVKYFEQIRFGNGEYCPHCGNSHINRFSDGKRFRCAKCKKDFTIKTKTVFGESKISLQKWFIAIYLLSVNKKGISSINLASQVGVTQKTAWFMDHRIRKAMTQNKGQLFGTYHSMSKKHLQKYVDEFVYRFNNRANNLTDVFADVVSKVSDSKKLSYKNLTA